MTFHATNPSRAIHKIQGIRGPLGLLVVLTLLSLGADRALGQRAEYIGTDPGNYDNANNWDIGEVPDGSNGPFDVSIGSNSVLLDTSAQISNFAIDSGGSLQSFRSDLIFQNPNAAFLNNGTFLMDFVSTGFLDFTDLAFGNRELTINGNGTIFMISNARIIGNADGQLNHGVGHRIEGSGQVIGGTLNNSGTILANGGGSIGVGVTNDSSNSGLLSSSNGALIIGGQAGNRLINEVGNQQGTISARAGGTSTIDTLRVEGGQIVAERDGTIALTRGADLDGVEVRDGGRLDANTGTLRGLDNQDGGLVEVNNLTFQGGGTFRNDGAIRIEGLGELNISGQVEVVGDGTIQLDGAEMRGLGQNPTTPDTLTLRNQAVEGRGALGDYELVNRGSITADGGLLNIARAEVDNDGGVLGANDGSRLLISQSTPVRGGTLQTEGTGVVQTTLEATLDSVTNLGDLEAIGNTTLEGTIENRGTFEVNNISARVSGGDVTLTGDGTVITTTGGFRGDQPTDRIINGVDHTIRGGGNIGLNSAGVVNQGTIVADRNNTMFINPNDQGFVNEGTLRAEDGNTMIVLNTNGAFTNFNDGTLSSGTYEAINGTMLLANIDVETNGASILIDGVEAAFTSNGFGANALDQLRANTSRGELILRNGATQTTDLDFVNDGLVEIGLDSAFTIGGDGSGIYNQTDGLTIVDGELIASQFNIQGGELSGLGQLDGTLINNGFVSPSASPGLLSILDDYVQAENGALFIEIGGTEPGAEFDVLDIDGEAFLDGLLVVSLADDYVPFEGQQFDFLRAAGGISGGFGEIRFEGVSADAFDLILAENGVSLVAGVIPEPSSVILTTIGLAGVALLIRRSRRRNGNAGICVLVE